MSTYTEPDAFGVRHLIPDDERLVCHACGSPHTRPFMGSSAGSALACLDCGEHTCGWVSDYPGHPRYVNEETHRCVEFCHRTDAPHGRVPA
jgi:hypothetical protein